MNKSIEFVKNLIEIGRLYGGVPKDGWDSASVYRPFDLIHARYPAIAGTSVNGESELGNGKRVKTTVSYDPNADFSYVSSKQHRHDGTELFTAQGILEVVNKVLRAETCDLRAKPEDFESFPEKYSMHYIIGDVVVNSEFGDFGSDEKPWVHTRETIMLPIRMWFEPLSDVVAE